MHYATSSVAALLAQYYVVYCCMQQLKCVQQAAHCSLRSVPQTLTVSINH
jgi:hypothetical protein